MSLYIVPQVDSGDPMAGLVPKYLHGLHPYEAAPLGNTVLVAIDTTPEEDAAIGANADAFVVPDGQLADRVLARGPELRAKLELIGLPGQWVNNAMTYRTVMRMMSGMAQVWQRTEGGAGRKLDIFQHLDTAIDALPAEIRDNLLASADFHQVDSSAAAPGLQLRAVLHEFSRQFVATRIVRLGKL
jgi:hypothetical protein